MITIILSLCSVIYKHGLQRVAQTSQQCIVLLQTHLASTNVISLMPKTFNHYQKTGRKRKEELFYYWHIHWPRGSKLPLASDLWASQGRKASREVPKPQNHRSSNVLKSSKILRTQFLFCKHWSKMLSSLMFWDLLLSRTMCTFALHRWYSRYLKWWRLWYWVTYGAACLPTKNSCEEESELGRSVSKKRS